VAKRSRRTAPGRNPRKARFFAEQKMRPNEILKKRPVSVDSLQAEAHMPKHTSFHFSFTLFPPVLSSHGKRNWLLGLVLVRLFR
jgi:hypothetical protein